MRRSHVLTNMLLAVIWMPCRGSLQVRLGGAPPRNLQKVHLLIIHSSPSLIPTIGDAVRLEASRVHHHRAGNTTTHAAVKLVYCCACPDHDAGGLATWRAHWQPPLLAALCGDQPAAMTAASSAAAHGHIEGGGGSAAAGQLRANVSVYALPTALRLDPDSLHLLLQELLQLHPPQVLVT